MFKGFGFLKTESFKGWDVLYAIMIVMLKYHCGDKW